jgi:hypothetical protein
MKRSKHALQPHAGAQLPSQGFLLRLAPGAPHTARLLAGHPFSKTGSAEGEAQDEEQPLLTQLALGDLLVPAEVLSGNQLPPFKVCGAGDTVQAAVGGVIMLTQRVPVRAHCPPLLSSTGASAGRVGQRHVPERAAAV